jgi:hypothetical protein
LEVFFRAPALDEALRQIDEIERVAEGDVTLILTELDRLRLWQPIPNDQTTFSAEAGAGVSVDVTVRLPRHYDPTRRFPMILCMPRSEVDAEADFSELISILGETAHDHVLVRPTKPVGGSFHQPAHEGRDLSRLLREVGRRVHVDVDRMFLFGVDSGADAAWMAAVGHAYLFAGLIVLNGHPAADYPEQSLPLLLRNIQKLPVLARWKRVDDFSTSTQRD